MTEPKIVRERQEDVVRALQEHLLAVPHGKGNIASYSGHIKDVSIALGVAIDKLAVLDGCGMNRKVRLRPPFRPLGPDS